MKYKHRVFSKALRILEEEDYSCNALAFAIAPGDPLDSDREAAIHKYRDIYGFTGENRLDENDCDAFLMAVENERDSFGLRILLLSLAEVAWDDFD